jgi:hypothetical protein
MTWRAVRIAGWLYLGVLVVAPVWALRIFLWCWLGAFAVCVVLLGWYGARGLRRTVSGWRHARRESALFPYGYSLGPERANGEPFMEDRRVAP